MDPCRITHSVCTGNTCRSPMAEALCKVPLARRLGCSIDELEGRGYDVLLQTARAIESYLVALLDDLGIGHAVG